MASILFVSRSQYGYQHDYFYYSKYLVKRYKIKFICIDAGKPKFQINGVSINYVNKNKFIDQYYFWITAFKNIRNEKPDLIVINTFPFSYILPILLRTSIFILDIRSGAVSKNLFRRTFRKFQLKLNIFFFRNISVISESLALSLNIPSKKSKILPLGSEVFSVKNKEFNELILLYIGTFNNRKLNDTVEGFNIFYKEYRDELSMEYHIIGDGRPDEEMIIKNNIANNNLSKVVHLHGRMSHAKSRRYFNHCNIGVSYVPINNYYNVQPPTKTYEYLCSGLVVLATRTIENEKVINLENGILINDSAFGFYKGLIDIKNNLKLYSSDQIRNQSKKYNWEYIVKHHFIPIINAILK